MKQICALTIAFEIETMCDVVVLKVHTYSVVCHDNHHGGFFDRAALCLFILVHQDDFMSLRGLYHFFKATWIVSQSRMCRPGDGHLPLLSMNRYSTSTEWNPPQE